MKMIYWFFRIRTFSAKEAQASLNNVWQYIEQNNYLNDDDLNSLFTLKQRLDEIRKSNII